jgi:adenosine kinase
MSKLLVSWSTAYDYVMDYGDSFENHIKPESVHKLSVVFLIDMLKKEYGWTGHNICYNLALLGSNPLLFSSIWKDYIFSSLIKEKVDISYVYTSESVLSASFYVTSDVKWSQIGAFYPGAMNEADKKSTDEIREEISYAIVSPNKKEAMIQQATELERKKVPFFFDPGQQIFIMNGEDLKFLFEKCSFLILNDYEYEVFQEKIGISHDEIIASGKKVIVTLWEKGSCIYSTENKIDIPVVQVEKFVDPTWAGDAYRGWLLRGLELGYTWEKSAKMWSLLGSICVSKYGAQNHFVTPEEFTKLFEKHFGETIEL